MNDTDPNELEEQLMTSPMVEDDLEQAEPDEMGEPIAEVEPGAGLHAGPLNPDEEPITEDQIV